MNETKVAELYGLPTVVNPPQGWDKIAAEQHCPYLTRKCLKNRKSEPEQTIGTCTVAYGRSAADVIICPHRLLERRQIFEDCRHLLTLHEPGNELHLVTELNVPGGSIDYCLVSVHGTKPVDFIGIELQTLDTTGTVWPERQRFLRRHGVRVKKTDTSSVKGFGMNWKMTAKTTLVQLHHKIDTFQHVGKHLVLALQDHLMDYMRKEFKFHHLEAPKLGNSMHFHAYTLGKSEHGYRLQLKDRWSTDRNGIAKCLKMQGKANVEIEDLFNQLEAKLSPVTLLTLDPVVPVPTAAKDVSE